MSIISEHEGAGRPRGAPLSAIQCALALVTAGLAVAAVMLPLATSARPAQTSGLATLPQEEPYRRGSVLAESLPQGEVQRQGSIFSQFQPQGGPYRQGSVFAEFYPQPESTLAPLPKFMSMPVAGTWQVTCGYRCGLHTAANKATFALDIVSVEGESAGQPVRSPVDGLITAFADSATYFCHDEWNHGPEGGAIIAIDFQDPFGTAKRLRLAHLDLATIPDDLRPDGGPVPVEAGAFLGNVADIDDGCSHLHISLTRLEECRRGECREVPEPLVIEGKLLEDCDGDDCWQGAQLPPQGP